jgi:hypothetical protein
MKFSDAKMVNVRHIDLYRLGEIANNDIYFILIDESEMKVIGENIKFEMYSIKNNKIMIHKGYGDILNLEILLNYIYPTKKQLSNHVCNKKNWKNYSVGLGINLYIRKDIYNDFIQIKGDKSVKKGIFPFYIKPSYGDEQIPNISAYVNYKPFVIETLKKKVEREI